MISHVGLIVSILALIIALLQLIVDIIDMRRENDEDAKDNVDDK